MRRITLAFLGTLSSIVLLLAYPTSHGATAGGGTAGGAGTAAGPGEGAASGGTSGAASGGTSGGTSGKSGTSGTRTYTGAPADTRWGTVQVQITVRGGRITASKAVQFPNDNGHDQEVNAYALPILAQEVVAAQSASIDAVSGATVTSGGYVQSLQSALDAAHL